MYLVYFRVVKQVKASIIYIFPLSPKLLVICQMSFFAQTIDTCKQHETIFGGLSQPDET